MKLPRGSVERRVPAPDMRVRGSAGARCGPRHGSSPLAALSEPPCGCHALLLQASLPWEPLLTHDDLQRGVQFYGTGARLRRVAAKLLAGEPIKVRASTAAAERWIHFACPSRAVLAPY